MSLISNQETKTEQKKEPISSKDSSKKTHEYCEEHAFFTKNEMSTFLKEYDTIILYMDNGMPYINYDTAKMVFESVVGNNYSLEILSHEFISEFDTYMVHVRISLTRGDKKIFKDVIGCEKAKRKKENNEIVNFDNLPKSAVKDAFKKFLSDYIGIGSAQYSAAKKANDERNKNKAKNMNNSKNNISNNQEYKCSDCGVSIQPNVYNFSVNYHNEKRPLCTTCQKKY